MVLARLWKSQKEQESESSEEPQMPSPQKFDWEKAAQNIVKSHKKNTAKIHIPPENGLLSVSYPKDRIHEERSVSPQPPQPIQNTGFIANYPESD